MISVPAIIGLLLLVLSAVQLFRAIHRFHENKGSGMGQDMTFAYDYQFFLFIALAALWCFTHRWPILLGTAIILFLARYALQWLLTSLFESG